MYAACTSKQRRSLVCLSELRELVSVEGNEFVAMGERHVWHVNCASFVSRWQSIKFQVHQANGSCTEICCIMCIGTSVLWQVWPIVTFKCAYMPFHSAVHALTNTYMLLCMRKHTRLSETSGCESDKSLPNG